MYELILSSTPSEVVIALLKDKQLVELHREPKNTKFAVGDVYMGRVRKVLPSLNAAFVDVGYENPLFAVIEVDYGEADEKDSVVNTGKI